MAINFEKMKKGSLILTLFIPLGFTAYLFFSALSFPDENLLPEKGKKIELRPYQPLRYEFKASSDDLSAVKLLLENDEFAKGDKIKAVIKNASCDLVIREKTPRHSSLDSGIYVNFNFNKIADSKDKKYCLEIIYLSERDETEDLPSVYLSKNAGFPGETVTDVYRGKKYDNYSLLLKTAYAKGGVLENLEELDKRISQYKPWFFQKFCLASIVAALFVSSLIIVVLLINF